MRILAFDSGIGGITVLAPLLKKENNIEVVYFGDLAHFPYGTKSPERIRELTLRNIEFLIREKGSEKKFDLILVACNTASAQAIDAVEELGRKHQIPVVGMVAPSCRAALHSKPSRIVVLATPSTVRSEAYVRELNKQNASVSVVQKACPLFAPLVEDHLYSGPAVELIARRYLDSIVQPGDLMILGCTHYPFLLPALQATYSGHQWVEAGEAILSDAVVETLLKKNRTQVAPLPNTLNVYFSDKTASRDSVLLFLQQLGLEKQNLLQEFDILRS